MSPKVALTVDLVGTVRELTDFCKVLGKSDVRATFFVSGKVGEPEQIKIVLDGKHEVASHTLSHPTDLTRMSTDELESEIFAGHKAVVTLCESCAADFKVQGFRSPYYMFDERIPRALSTIGYLWDSSRAFFPALSKPFEFKWYDKILEIPSLFPDDNTLLSRLALKPERVEYLWKEAYRASKEYFVLGVHPYVIARDDERLTTLERFLDFLQMEGAEFLSMSEMANSIKHGLTK